MMWCWTTIPEISTQVKNSLTEDAQEAGNGDVRTPTPIKTEFYCIVSWLLILYVILYIYHGNENKYTDIYYIVLGINFD